MTYTSEFETFWKDYPQRWYRLSGNYYKVGKYEASQAWNRLSQKDRTKILIVVKYMRDGEFVLDAHRWLRKRRFDDMDIQKPKPRLRIAKEQTYAEWAEERKTRMPTSEARTAKAEYDKLKDKLFGGK